MNSFDSKTINAMRTVLEEVCSHLPANSNSARTFIASRILESARSGENTYDGLLAAARRAAVDQFGGIEAVRAALR